MKLLIHFQTWTVQPFHPTLYWACDYLSMVGLKSTHVSKRGPDGIRPSKSCEFSIYRIGHGWIIISHSFLWYVSTYSSKWFDSNTHRRWLRRGTDRALWDRIGRYVHLYFYKSCWMPYGTVVLNHNITPGTRANFTYLYSSLVTTFTLHSQLSNPFVLLGPLSIICIQN